MCGPWTSRPRATPGPASTGATMRAAPSGSWWTRTATSSSAPPSPALRSRSSSRPRRSGWWPRCRSTSSSTRCPPSPPGARCGCICSRLSASPARAAGRRGRRIGAMDVVVAGGHGKVGIRLLGLLADGGHRARGLIRNPDHADDLTAAGAEAVICDMEALDDLSECCAGADAVVFAAGAGPGSGAERKRTVDHGAAVKLMEAGARRYVMASAISARTDLERGEIPRDDVAAVVLAVLETPST